MQVLIGKRTLAVLLGLLVLLVGAACGAENEEPADVGEEGAAAGSKELMTGDFNDFDADNNDELSEQEFTEGVFGNWDADNSGTIGEEEFNERSDTWFSDTTANFGDFDADNNNELSQQEFTEGAADAGFFADWDADANGAIDENEFNERSRGGATTQAGGTMGGTTGGDTMMGGTTMGQAGTPVSAIIDNPERYYGQEVEVSGGVGQVIEPRALAMLDQQDLRAPGAIPEATITDRGLLLINTNDANPTLSERQNVRASGVLEPFDIATVEQDLGVDLDDALYTEYEDRPVILADQVRPAQGGNTQMETTSQ